MQTQEERALVFLVVARKVVFLVEEVAAEYLEAQVLLSELAGVAGRGLAGVAVVREGEEESRSSRSRLVNGHVGESRKCTAG
jgi:hypothetical protein